MSEVSKQEHVDEFETAPSAWYATSCLNLHVDSLTSSMWGAFKVKRGIYERLKQLCLTQSKVQYPGMEQPSSC